MAMFLGMIEIASPATTIVLVSCGNEPLDGTDDAWPASNLSVQDWGNP